MLAVDVTLNGLTSVWYEGQPLVISEVTASKDSTDVTTGNSDVKYTYIFTDVLTSNTLQFDVDANFSPNQSIPWASFAAVGIDNGTNPFIDVTVTATQISTGDTASDNTTIAVLNAPPTISNDSAIPDEGEGCGGGSNTVTLAATISDVLADIPNLATTVDWGDDSPDLTSFTGSAQHTYAEGTYTITLTVFDDDIAFPAEVVKTYQVTVGPGGPSGPSVCFDEDTGVVTITGSSTDDTVVVNAPNGNVRFAANFLPGPNQFVEFPAAEVTEIVALLGDGNDVFTVAGNVSLPIVAVGGAGDDTLTGGSFRSILIGGVGADTLYGGRGEDVLIGGWTDHDADAAALLALMAEWSSSHTLEERIRNLVNGTGTVGGGANGAVFLTDGATGTIHDDGDVDVLISGAGTDWLFLNGVAEHLLALGSNHDLLGDDLDSLF